MGKCIFDLEAKQERIDGLKNVFFQRAANKLVNIDLVYNIEENAPRVRNFYTYASQIFSKPQKPVVDIIPVQEQNAAAVLEQNAAAVKQANGDAISGLEWKKIEKEEEREKLIEKKKGKDKEREERDNSPTVEENPLIKFPPLRPFQFFIPIAAIEVGAGGSKRKTKNKRSQRKTKNKRCKKNRKTKHGQKKKRKTKKR